MVGGELQDFETIKPVLSLIGKKATYIGANGKALSMKIALNLNLAVQMLAVSESILLAESCGIERSVALDVIQHSAIASPLIQYRTPLIAKDTDGLPEEAWFSNTMMQKDIAFAMSLAKENKVHMPSTSLVNEYLTVARAIGWEKEDFASLYHVVGIMSGREKPQLHSTKDNHA